jgi:hypothetical protein
MVTLSENWRMKKKVRWSVGRRVHCHDRGKRVVFILCIARMNICERSHSVLSVILRYQKTEHGWAPMSRGGFCFTALLNSSRSMLLTALSLKWDHIKGDVMCIQMSMVYSLCSLVVPRCTRWCKAPAASRDQVHAHFSRDAVCSGTPAVLPHHTRLHVSMHETG